ncbi:hypothetical protein BU26DRAFT_549851 [Trematosphaeria pertusa]|uniref:F-box domain-containing protein n=1 Tax=Trematosphaeria pertusa TaxID=390896 RepID=A0A6A6IP27_9PLEO|nr:uncharacterized protein BU26DRAFT_549851 [Trematosphaeria pertusa]KAF2251340.1 hypothetical protein BU26DRAFT_549851 [Trematosphaeria pertusa]
MTYHTTYTSFGELLRGLDGYIDELAPYRVDGTQTIFPKLPLELREQIYGYILDPKPASIHPLPPYLGDNLMGDLRYEILHVNKATRIDAGLFYIRSKKFDIWITESRGLFTKFLERFPGEQGFWSVRHLVFHKFYWDIPEGRYNPNIELMLRCKGLRTVSLTFHRSWFLKVVSMEEIQEDGTSFVQNAKGIEETYRLNDIFGLENIEKIELRSTARFQPCRRVETGSGAVMGWYDAVSLALSPRTIMVELRDWLKAGFGARGRRVAVEVVTTPGLD